MYIYSIGTKKCKIDKVSYGYPMGMVWVSYGAHSRLVVHDTL